MDQSNPLLSDPSIIQVSSNDHVSVNDANGTPRQSDRQPNSQSEGQSNTNITKSSLEPGNALSQLLDSAMLKAAKESSPEFEAKINSSVSSPRSNKSIKFEFYAQKQHYDNIYSIEELLSLKDSPNMDVISDLPSKEFWCLHVGKKPHPKEFNSNRYGGRRGNNNNNNFRKEGDFRKKKSGVEELLGDENEAEPEWDSVGIDDNLKLEMGDTVEDFEKWKQSQRRKNDPTGNSGAGGSIEQLQLLFFQPDPEPVQQHNDVDNFFSFVKPSAPTEEKKDTSTKSESFGKSSRFSSFFNPSSMGASANSTRSQVSTPQASQVPPVSVGQQPLGPASRFFSGSNAPNTNVNSPMDSKRPSVATTSNPSTPQQAQVAPVQNPSNFQGQPPQPPGLMGVPQPPPGLDPKNFSSPVPGGPVNGGDVSKQQQFSQPPGQPPQQPPNGMPLGMMPPMGLNGKPPVSNDSFFMSLMNKAPGENMKHQLQDHKQTLHRPILQVFKDHHQIKIPKVQ